jgi:hypothetical protein
MRTPHTRTALGHNPLQSDLLPNLADAPAFFGESFSQEPDGKRLTSQLQSVEAVMADGYWRTLPNISTELRRRYPGSRYAETSISARLRDMRRRGWQVEHERIRPRSGLYQYRARKLEVAREAA